ncbi:hypothetical protein MKW92_032786, partial [Papaver armeniacum]
GYSQYMKRSELESSSYLKDDCLSITCTISVLQTRDEEGKPKHQVIHVPPSDVTQNLKDLLKSEVGCDVTFRVGNEFFRAHKLILAARSPVFRAQFFGSFGNPDIETVTIQEFEPFAFKAMLLFLYSDEVPETHELSNSDSPCTSTTIMQHLLVAADRFGLTRLKIMCEEKLYEQMTANTVATTLALAEQHQCPQLKTVCLNFAAKPENLAVSNPKVNYKIVSSQSIYETVNGSHEYKIKGYALAKGMGVGKYMSSRTFTVGGHDWFIRFYRDGDRQGNEEYVCLFLELVSPGEVKAFFEFKLLDQSENGKHGVHKYSEGAKTFNTAVNRSWGYSQYMKRSELETSSYLKDDCITIHCTVKVLQTRDEEGKHYVIHVPPSDMNQNLRGLLDSEIGHDITFQVGNEFFRAHKLILAARSPVFKAQFFGSMGNPGLETVAIKEFEPFAFKAMLLFLYSDELPEPSEIYGSDSLCSSTTLVQHLLAAADLYDLARLKLMCEAKLCEAITANTVATTLALAERHHCPELKTICLNFAAKPENFGEVMKSDGYAYLEKSCSSLLTDLLKTSLLVDDKTQA